MSAQRPRPESPPLPEHVTIPLLSKITAQSMDEDYEHVARARAAGAQPPETRTTRTWSTVVVAVFGTLVAIAGVQTARNADSDALGRSALIGQIQDEKGQLAAIQDRVGELVAANSTLEETLRTMGDRQDDLAARVRRVASRTGFGPVTGPGVVFQVNDAEGGDETQVVRDDDLAILVDGLWAAGAEAIAINGQRLTARTSIQNSGRAIHVNTRPLAPPYTVEVIGNQDTLPARLLNTAHGAAWYALARSLAFRFSMDNDDDLSLPAARMLPLRQAQLGSAADLARKQKEALP
ncbi:DUF881 domain-containing protein [Nocardioides sp. LHG3406-4]|uniref:DUF881 domain-containing protein n=1 Tax=Nocardioides sp. LHG3406-4 TaxID=2804575 RepID=UPI003CECC24F